MRRRWPATLAILLAVGCAGGDDDTGTSSTSTSRPAASTSSTLPEGLRDACEVLPPEVVARVIGRDVTAEAVAALGGGATCDHRPTDDPAAWTISVFVFERDTEGNAIDARDAYTRFRAETAGAVDLDDVGDVAFLDAPGLRAGAVVGDVYVDVTAVRFDDTDRLVALLRAAVDALRGG